MTRVARANSTFEQNSARIETHTAQVRSKLESDARTLAAEFQRVGSLFRQALTEARARLQEDVTWRPVQKFPLYLEIPMPQVAT